MRRSLSDTDQNEEITKMLASRQKSWGNMTLYFGCRRYDLDYIYKDELVKAKLSGALTDVHVAFSREPCKPKVRVVESYNYTTWWLAFSREPGKNLVRRLKAITWCALAFSREPGRPMMVRMVEGHHMASPLLLCALVCMIRICLH